MWIGFTFYENIYDKIMMLYVLHDEVQEFYWRSNEQYLRCLAGVKKGVSLCSGVSLKYPVTTTTSATGLPLMNIHAARSS